MLDSMVKPEEGKIAMQFRPRPDDVIISPFAKCGTTWLQQIFHQLRTGGDEDHDDISRVVPWIETSPALGIDLDAEQKGEPRGFKSHLSWTFVPKGGRYVVSFRDPRDAAVSFYRFMEGWFLEPGSVPIDQFVRKMFLFEDAPEAEPYRGYWSHLLSWLEAGADDAVLLLTYEGMLRDPERAVRQVARHAGIDADDRLVALAVERSSIGYMAAHKHQFDDLCMRRLTVERLGLPSDSDSAKVRQGTAGSHREELSADVIDAIDRRWSEHVAPVVGHESYASLASEIDGGS